MDTEKKGRVERLFSEAAQELEFLGDSNAREGFAHVFAGLYLWF